MIIGDSSIFAIESGITQAFERLSLRALGFFVIHVGSRRYGVYKPEATMLACSVDEVECRIGDRGKHLAPFAANLDAGEIADAFRMALYADKQHESYFGIPLTDFRQLFNDNHLVWAPDGDEAFDDGSYVLQFDIDDRVRLIAFKSGENYLHNPTTLSDVWLSGDTFYQVLEKWHDIFQAEWVEWPKRLV